jgi:pullulanase/glycogen debranching enzyme
MPGRLIGRQVGIDAFHYAEQYFAPPGTAVVDRVVVQPLAFELNQNYPNPFNSDTVISFAIPQRQEVTLVVYNLTGQSVATLATGVHTAGTYALHWDGRDDRNRELASGLYVYRLQTDQHSATRKLLLIR